LDLIDYHLNGQVQLKVSLNIIFCVLQKTENYTGLEQLKSEQIMTI